MNNAGAIRAGKAYVEATLDDSKLVAGLNRAQARIRDFGKGLEEAGKGMLAFGATLFAPLAVVTKFASRAQEMGSKFDAVFGGAAEGARAFAADLSRSVGRSTLDVQDAMSTYQAFFKGMGFGERQAASMSEKLSALAIDFASFHNISDEDANLRFRSGLAGEAEPLSRYGINVRAAAVDQQFFKMGLDVTSESATETQKALARLAIITEAMTAQGAVGDAVRTSAGFANQLKRLQATATDAAVAVGSALLPAVTNVVSQVGAAVASAAEWANANAGLVTAVGTAAVQTTLWSVGVGAAVFAVGKLAGIAAAAASGVGMLGKSLVWLAANPAAAVLVGLAAIAGAVGYSMYQSANYVAKFNTEMGKALDQGDQGRRVDAERLARLEQLGQADQLNADGMKEAATLIGQLQSKYGDLGLSLDQTAGKVNGLTDAHAKLNEQMRRQAIADVKASLAEAQANSNQADRQRASENTSDWNMANFGRLWNAATGGGPERIQSSAGQDQGRASALREKALLSRLRDLEHGDADAVFGNAKRETAAAASVEDSMKAQKKLRDDAVRAAERLADLDDQQADKHRSATEREIADIRKVAAERRKLLDEMIAGERVRTGGPRASMMRWLQDRRGSVLGQEAVDIGRALGRGIVAAAAAVAEKVRDVIKGRVDLSNDLGRQEAAQTVTEAEQAVQRAQDLKDPAGEESARKRLHDAKVAAAKLEADQFSRDQLAKAQDLYKEDPKGLTAAEARIKALADRMRQVPDDLPKVDVGAIGTFSAIAAARIGGGGSAAERTAKATEATAKSTKAAADVLGRMRPAAFS